MAARLTIVIPCYNEEESIPELFDALEAVVAREGYECDYLFVDDGSTDRTLAVLRSLRERTARVGVISFRRNYGKSAALAMAFRHITGDIVITMDADLQDDPEEIPNLVARIEGGADLVSGWKVDRKDPISKTVPSRLFNAVTSLASGIKLHDFNCGLKAYRREVAESINLYGELHRFIPVLAGWEGFKVAELPVRHYKRKYGQSKFGARRFLNGFFDLVTVMFVTRRALNPLHFFGRVSALLFMVGAIPQVWFFLQWLTGSPLRVRPIMLLGLVLIIVSLQIGSMGLVAEMLSARSAPESSYSLKEHLVGPRGHGEPV